MKNLVLIFTFTNFIVGFILPMLRTFKATGVFPISFNKADKLQKLIGKIYVFSMISIFFSAISFTLFPMIYQLLVPINILQIKEILFGGLILNQISILWIVIGQKQMENSWRIGIHNNEKTKLVTGGLYRISRHPISLGLVFLIFSGFLCMPNILTLVIVVVAFIFIRIEAILEEKELIGKHGNLYIDYRKKTRRWI